ncbi:MAG: hypothetical protein AB1489_03135 [Acidobacteriota bacterium]
MKPTELGATFQIPKFAAQVELLLVDKRRLSGKLFLSIIPSSPLGHIPLLDSMNESVDFFPFLPNDSTETEILSKWAVIEAVVDTELNQDEIGESLEQTTWIESVEVRCHPYLTLTGRVMIDLPPDRSRVLDFLNQHVCFFALKRDEKSHIINKKYITSVKELTSLPTSAPTAKRARRDTRRTGKKP